MKRTKRTELFEYGYSDELMPLAEFKGIVDQALVSVPEGIVAMFEVDRRWGEEGSSKFIAYYDQQETDEEYTARLAQERENAARQAEINELRTRAIYERLKARYEP
jgi:hypothetical protein